MQQHIDNTVWLDRHTKASLARLLPRLEARFATRVEADQWQGYLQRVYAHFPRLFGLLYSCLLYTSDAADDLLQV